MDEDDERKRDVAMLEACAARLAEHFDTVQIFCTRHLGVEGTAAVQAGAGNWYARLGQVGEWVLKEEARSAGEVDSGGE